MRTLLHFNVHPIKFVNYDLDTKLVGNKGISKELTYKNNLIHFPEAFIAEYDIILSANSAESVETAIRKHGLFGYKFC